LIEQRYGGEQVSVEVAAYVLLSYAHNLPDTLDQALPVFRGITQQLSDSGGFKSTQDTVIGIQAMAKFATYLTDDDMNMEVSLTLNGAPEFTSDPVTNDNKDLVVVQNVNLTDDFAGMARLSSAGAGSVFTQLVQHYNVRDQSQDPFELEFFVVNVVKRSTDRDIPDRVCIRVVTQATDNEEFRVPDGMSLVLVEHPSGFVYDDHTVEDETEEPQKVEQDSEKTTFYFNDLKEEKRFTICMRKTEDVANPRPIFITVQDYYNPDATSNVEVELTSQQGANYCDLCGDLCSECVTDSSSLSTPSGNIGWTITIPNGVYDLSLSFKLSTLAITLSGYLLLF
jgi:CD109 antigen